MTSWVVFTDLDETLLDRETYSFEAARAALSELARRRIPIVFCTSKTSAESLELQSRMGIDEPFAYENGGGIRLPRGYFGVQPDRIALAPGRAEMLVALEDLRRFTEGSIRSYSEMSVDELSKESGLPPEAALRAKAREFDEPFRFTAREEVFAPRLAAWAATRGLRITQGSRYWHLHGDSDKGRAVSLLTDFYRSQRDDVRTIGIGDSSLDVSLLASVDLPIAVQSRQACHEAALSGIPGVRLIPARGPVGWSLGVLEALNSSQ